MILLAEATSARESESPSAFIFIWILLGIGSFLFFHFHRNTALKRRVFPVFVIATAVVFGGFIYFAMGRQQPQVLLVAVPALVLISFLNIRQIRFCDSCGKTLYRQPVFSRPQFCPHCGGKLQ